jgi:1-acyl-sn-glycerol-3-phosphate acyltransferase
MLKRYIISGAIWSAGAVVTILLYFVMLLCAVVFPFDRQRRIAHAQCFWWSTVVLALNPYWRLAVSGLENIDRKKTYVIVANHQSLADIVVMYQTRMQFKWVAKESLFKLPFIGWNLCLARHIKLKRGNLSSVKKIYREASEWLKAGMSVLFFPEGTRSETGEMRDFQNGAFKLAIKEKKPVLPILLKGTKEAIPKGSWLFSEKVTCTLRVFPAVNTVSYEMRDFERLRDLVRSTLAEAAGHID